MTGPMTDTTVFVETTMNRYQFLRNAADQALALDESSATGLDRDVAAELLWCRTVFRLADLARADYTATACAIRAADISDTWEHQLLDTVWHLAY